MNFFHRKIVHLATLLLYATSLDQMKFSVRIILFSAGILCANISLSNPTIPELRKTFHNAVLDPSFLPDFLDKLDEILETDAIQLAYKAASEALQAQQKWNPLEKLVHLKKFRKMMDEAVNMDIEEVEIRFLRFGIEYNIPQVLGFSPNLSEDKTMIMKSVSVMNYFEIDPFFSVYILTLLQDSGLCTNEEIEMVRSKIEYQNSAKGD